MDQPAVPARTSATLQILEGIAAQITEQLDQVPREARKNLLKKPKRGVSGLTNLRAWPGSRTDPNGNGLQSAYLTELPSALAEVLVAGGGDGAETRNRVLL